MMSHGHPIVLALLLGALLAGTASAGSPKDIQNQGKEMVKDAEEMVAHGGMGDAKAIVHHCAEVAKHA
ncbi:MAG: hypothetical protein HP494_19815, partial [Nitrospira sp.]|nr:hypothetical protein [Nitrospira sp.]